MTESALTTAVANALSGTTDSDLDVTFCEIGEATYHATDYKKEAIILRLLKDIPSTCRVFKDGDLTFGVRAGYFLDGDTVRTYSGASAQALTDDDTNYIYLTTAGVLTVNITGFPTPSETPHIRLATILTASSEYAHTDIVQYRSTAMLSPSRGPVKLKFTARIPGTWPLDGDAKNGGLAGLDTAGDLTATEAAAAYAKVYNHDDTSYANLSASSGNGAFTSNYQLFPDTEVENDAAYFGHSLPFCEMWIDVATAGAYNADSITWEYSKAASWGTLTVAHDYTDSTAQDGLRPFQRDGAIQFVPPSDWAAVAVSGQTAYWIRARCNATVDIGTIPKTNSVEHYICTPTDGIRIPVHCQITDVRLVDEASTIHTATDIKFYLHNFTKGTTSAEMTFAQDRRMDAWTGDTFACDAGDIIWPLVTQEDGTNEAGPVTLELDATRL